MNVMYYLKRIKEVSTDFYQNVRFFNVKVAVTKTLVPKLCKDSDKMHQAILNYVEPRYADLVQSYVGLEQSSSIVLTDDCPIWVCWLQGEDQMPFICKKCMESIRKHAGKHPVIMITFDNYQEYVTVPSYILEKVGKEISYTHFSDILRVNLLADHGGMWMDSTIYVTQDLPDWNLPFYTLKQDLPNDKSYFSLYRWSGFFQGGVKNNLFHCFLRDFLYLYYEKEKALIEYSLMDYIIDIGYRYVPAIKQMVDKVPYSCQGIHELRKMLYLPLDKDKLNTLIKQNYAFKLTYKNMPAEIDPHSVYYYLFCR